MVSPRSRPPPLVARLGSACVLLACACSGAPSASPPRQPPSQPAAADSEVAVVAQSARPLPCPDKTRHEAGLGCVPVVEPPPGEPGRREIASDPDDAPGQTQIERLVKTYYDNEGEFHGQYVIAAIVAMRVEVLGTRSLEVHVRYQFQCVRDQCCCGDSGYDQRTFRLERRTSGWRATRMGAHMSAVL